MTENRNADSTVQDADTVTVTVRLTLEEADRLFDQRFSCGCGEGGIPQAVEDALREALEANRD